MRTTTTSKSAAVIFACLSLFFFCIMILVNGLANSLPMNGMTTGELSAFYPNLFVPAGITFSIWGVIYLLLALFVAYALSLALSRGLKPILSTKQHIIFSLSCIMNSLWIFLWHYKLIGLSLIAMLFILSMLILLYLDLDSLHLENFRQKLAIKIPISVYLGWITVATVANTTALLVDRQWGRWSISENHWAIGMIIIGGIIALIMLLKRRDIPFTLVVIWAYVGIIIRRQVADPVYHSIILCAWTVILILVFTLLVKIFSPKKPNATFTVPE